MNEHTASKADLSSPPSATHVLLQRLYPNVDTLLDYLCGLIPGFASLLAVASPPASHHLHDLHSILNLALVGYENSTIKFQPAPPEMTQEEVGSSRSEGLQGSQNHCT